VRAFKFVGSLADVFGEELMMSVREDGHFHRFTQNKQQTTMNLSGTRKS